MDYILKHARPNVDKVLACWRRYKAELENPRATNYSKRST